MARFFSQTLIRTSSSSSISPQTFKLGVSQPHRFSSRSGKAQLVEVDLESEGDVEVLGLRKLDDVIQSIIVRRSAPDWLPFIPGSSYWVPPRRHRRGMDGIIEVLRKINVPLSEEETMSLTTSRGWPSSNYFIQGASSMAMHPTPVEVEMEVYSNQESESKSKAEDEEG